MQVGFAALAVAILAVALLIPTGSGAQRKQAKSPVSVQTKSDAARAKMDNKLQRLVERGANKKVFVFATVRADAAAAAAKLLDDSHVAKTDQAALVVGALHAQQATKLAGTNGVLAVHLVQLKKTASPLGDPEPGLNRAFDKSAFQKKITALRRTEVPEDKVRPPRGSNFDDLKRLAVLDAKTHSFAEAWRAGFAGEGTTLGVLDGGTDWAHPDLLGTWQTWDGATDSTFTDDGWNGWPKAFDPYDTLVLLAEPDFVDQGLTWYTPTQAKSSLTPAGNQYRVSFATLTGPSRNSGVAPGTATHTYTFPKKWTKSGTVRMGSHPDDYLLDGYGERPAILVTDPNKAGVYDTVYVDLDDDYSFADEKPVTKSSPASYRDMNDDGYNDISGGLLYFISDGQTALPGGVMRFSDGSADFRKAFTFGPGEMLAWTGDYDPGIEGHGTLTASNVVGQGVINGLAPCFADLRGRPGAQNCDIDGDGRGGTYPGAVIGGAPHAKLAPFGDIYFAFEFSTQLGYLLSTRSGVDVTSNSYGDSTLDNDGFDASSQEADIWHSGTRTTPLFATGNGAPGFGTTTPPSPFSGIKVGASTQFGGTGWDSIRNASQIVDNDVMVWSNRGPGATGANGMDVVADGAFSAGDLTLNAAGGDGRFAWETWGGTSRSTPVAAAATALIYQAWRSTHGSTVPVDFWGTSKDILKSSADDLGYDAWTQGSGSVDAGRAVKVAAGSGTYISPSEWRPGDFRGKEYPVFTHLIAPGGSDTQTFDVNGANSGWSVSDRYLTKTFSKKMSFKSEPVSDESTFNFNAPDYLMDLTSLVKSHPSDLMVIRANFPRKQFDGDADYTADQAWRLLAYDWTDIDHNGRLWKDQDGDGVVDHVDKATSTNIDGNLDIDFSKSEMDQGEYERFMYHRAGSNTLQAFVREPNSRMADGIFLGLQHSAKNAAIPRTDFKFRIDFYRNVDWPWLTASPVSGGQFSATLDVPRGTPYGMYEGGIVLTKGDDRIFVPVSAAVGAVAPQDGSGNVTGNVTLGGKATESSQRNLLYNNGSFFGANDWTWREESGDWRFYFLDVRKPPPVGSIFLTDTAWKDAAPFTDLDTLIFGRSQNEYQLSGGTAPVGAPYILGTVGASSRAYLGSGTWAFDTATGGAEDFVTAPMQEGLHAIVEHGVGYDGGKFDVPFKTTVGSAVVAPSEVNATTSSNSGAFDVTFKSTLDLSGVAADAFGLSQPTVLTRTAHQDDPNDPTSASVKEAVTINHASKARFATALDGNDVDLYVLYDANGNGTFSFPSEVVGSSTSAGGDEEVTLVRPADGNYQVWVHGFAVSGTPSFQLTEDVVQGTDMTATVTPTGPVSAGTPVKVHVTFSKSMTSGQDYFGELLLGPLSAPTAVHVPITIHRN
ncbi:MAG TPA: S8 family serine peptidase [Gaiellaceae bacterium]